jgi:hypothetical protein
VSRAQCLQRFTVSEQPAALPSREQVILQAGVGAETLEESARLTRDR